MQLMRGGVVIYESTVYPGVVDELCAPLLARLSGDTERGLFVGYSQGASILETSDTACPTSKDHGRVYA